MGAMVNTERPVVAITMGDPCGIGPEVIVKALSEPDVHAICRPIVIGSVPALEAALELTNAPLNTRPIDAPHQAEDDLSLVNIIDPQNLDYRQITVGRISPSCGRAAMEWVTAAAHLALDGSVNALATAPVNKEAASLAGYKAIGHMELLQEITGVSAVATMLISGSLRVVHLTTHRSLRVACDYVTRERVLSMLELTHDSFRRWGFPEPRIAAAALNPHASDGGLLGDEEAEAIAPAVRDAQRRGILARGPVPADVVFHQAIRGAYDVVLAMYHDQGHIPIKVHGFEQSVSVNLGLPFVRASVDHGTAFDISGQGIADHTSMVETIRLASLLSTGQGLATHQTRPTP